MRATEVFPIPRGPANKNALRHPSLTNGVFFNVFDDMFLSDDFFKTLRAEFAG
jgi:hypothetical protein